MNFKREEAFTLIELMLSIVLISLILGMLFNLNLSGWKFFRINQNNVELSQQSTLIYANLDHRIRNTALDKIDVSDETQLVFLDDDDTEIFKFYIENERLVAENLVESKKRYITEKIVVNYKFEEINNNFIKYSFELDNNNKTFEINKSVKPRI